MVVGDSLAFLGEQPRKKAPAANEGGILACFTNLSLDHTKQRTNARSKGGPADRKKPSGNPGLVGLFQASSKPVKQSKPANQQHAKRVARSKTQQATKNKAQKRGFLETYTQSVLEQVTTTNTTTRRPPLSLIQCVMGAIVPDRNSILPTITNTSNDQEDSPLLTTQEFHQATRILHSPPSEVISRKRRDQRPTPGKLKLDQAVSPLSTEQSLVPELPQPATDPQTKALVESLQRQVIELQQQLASQHHTAPETAAEIADVVSPVETVSELELEWARQPQSAPDEVEPESTRPSESPVESVSSSQKSNAVRRSSRLSKSSNAATSEPQRDPSTPNNGSTDHAPVEKATKRASRQGEKPSSARVQVTSTGSSVEKSVTTRASLRQRVSKRSTESPTPDSSDNKTAASEHRPRTRSRACQEPVTESTRSAGSRESQRATRGRRGAAKRISETNDAAEQQERDVSKRATRNRAAPRRLGVYASTPDFEARVNKRKVKSSLDRRTTSNRGSARVSSGNDLYMSDDSDSIFDEAPPRPVASPQESPKQHVHLPTGHAGCQDTLDTDFGKADSLDGWSRVEVESLRAALRLVDPRTTINFWEDVAQHVDGHSAAECCEKWGSLNASPAAKQKAEDPSEWIELTKESDDFFDSTPFRDAATRGAKSEGNGRSGIKVGRIRRGDYVSRVREFEFGNRKTGYKGFMKGVKKTISEANKKDAKRKKASQKDKPIKTRSVSMVETNGDVEVKAKLTPGGTLRIQDNLSEIDDFFDEVLSSDEDCL